MKIKYNKGQGPDEPKVEKPKDLRVRVIAPARNPRFVYADLNGERIAVACLPKYAKLITGKTITVKKDGENYQHLP